MNEHHLRVARTARYFTLGDAKGPITDLWYACHGYGQLASQLLSDFTVIERPGRLVVAPEGLSRYYTNHAAREVGASWMTKEDRLHEIADYVAYLDALHAAISATQATEPRARVLGFSQGVATATRWAARGAVSPGQLILWGGALPPDLDPDRDLPRLRAWDLVFVIGERDKYLVEGQIERERERIEAAGLTYRFVTFDGGHRMDDDTLRSLAD